MSGSTLFLANPELDWSPDGPRARQVEDVYFSVEDGLEEARAVFLSGCGLPDGFAGRERYTIAEMGFGTGLNFLAAWDLFRRTAPAGSRLHFVTLEGYPLRAEDAARALAPFGSLAELRDALIAAWPSPRKGAHRRIFDQGRVTLTVFQDDALSALENMELTADAWFLDGFAPAKNPDMWSPAVCAEIARLSRPGTRAATFTVAGAVRRELAAAGFAVSKVPGYGRKRERLEAVFEGKDAVGTPSRAALPRLEPDDGPIAIIGGGIAAASLVYALRLRGRTAEVFAEDGLCAGASGAPRGLLSPRLEAADRPHVRATLAAFEYARALYGPQPGFTASGLLRAATDDAETARLSRLAQMLGSGYEAVSENDAASLTGLDADTAGRLHGLWIEDAGHFDPAGLVHALFGEQGVQARRVDALERAGDAWILRDRTGAVLSEASTVVLAPGAGLSAFEAAARVSVEHTAGRIALFPAAERVPSAPIAWGHYAAPLEGPGLLVGATHLRGSDSGDPLEACEALAEGLAERLPEIASTLGQGQSGWGGVRAAFADRLPATGGVAGPRFDDAFTDHAKGGPLPEGRTQCLQPGLAVLGGFGARGFAHAPLLAEALASDLCGDPSPLELSGRQTLHPARFALRALRRK